MGYVETLLEHDEKQKIKGAYVKTDNFDFLRFKYRVMMHSLDHDKLRMNCASILASSPDKEQQTLAKYGLALLESDSHNVDQALQYLAAVREQYPAKDILEIDQAVLLIDGGRMEEARQLLEKAFKRDPTDMYGVYQLAKMELMQGKSTRAEQLLQKVAVVMPEYLQLYFDLGRIEAPLLNVYALDDHIVPPAASRALAGLTRSKRYDEIAVPTGHIGIFVSQRAAGLPARIAEWLARR